MRRYSSAASHLSLSGGGGGPHSSASLPSGRRPTSQRKSWRPTSFTGGWSKLLLGWTQSKPTAAPAEEGRTLRSGIARPSPAYVAVSPLSDPSDLPSCPFPSPLSWAGSRGAGTASSQVHGSRLGGIASISASFLFFPSSLRSSPNLFRVDSSAMARKEPQHRLHRNRMHEATSAAAIGLATAATIAVAAVRCLAAIFHCRAVAIVDAVILVASASIDLPSHEPDVVLSIEASKQLLSLGMRDLQLCSSDVWVDLGIFFSLLFPLLLYE